MGKAHAHRRRIRRLNPVGQEYLRGFAAQFELQALHRRRRLRPHHAAHFGRAGKADHVDGGIGGQKLGTLRARFGQNAQHPLGQSRFRRDLGKRQRA